MQTLTNLNINDIINNFEYTGEFLDKTDLNDLLSGYNFNNKDELIDYLNDNDGSYIGDTISSLADSKVDCYYYDLRKWSVDNYSYIEDAIREFGVDTNKPDFHQLIQQGQYYAFSNEFYTLINEFKEYIETLDFEEEEGEM